MKHFAQHGGDAFEASRQTGLPQREILDFSLNVNPFGPPQAVFEAIQAKMDEIKHYPPRTYLKLRKAVASYLCSFKGYKLAKADSGGSAGIDQDNIVVGCGTTELIHSFLARFMRGGLVAIPLPTFSEYGAAAAALGIPTFKVDPKGLRVDLEAIREIIGEGGASCAIVCNPNNPTGELLGKARITELLESAAAKGAYLMIDEAYLDLSSAGLGESLIPLVTDYDKLIVLRSLTKLFGFPGLRVGYAVCSSGLASEFESTAISWRVGAIEEEAALAALKIDGFLEESRAKIQSEKIHLIGELEKIDGLKIEDSSANFILVEISRTGLSPANLKWRLLSHGVLVRELGGLPGLEGSYIRVCVRKRDENAILLKALKDVLTGISQMGNFTEKLDCESRPCHFKDQDCRICFCPFYPCLDDLTDGRFKDSRFGGKVWSCNDCHWIHEAGNAVHVIGELGRSGVNILSTDPTEILDVRKRVLAKSK